MNLNRNNITKTAHKIMLKTTTIETISIICSDPGILYVNGIEANTAAANPLGGHH